MDVEGGDLKAGRRGSPETPQRHALLNATIIGFEWLLIASSSASFSHFLLLILLQLPLGS